MKVVILAGGLGTRIMEETESRPKPMIEIGGKPIIWHIMKIYSFYGFNEFIICLGYKGHIIKNYFINYHSLNSDIEIDTSNNKITYLNRDLVNFKIKLIDTGELTNTAGRIKKIQKYVDNEFMLTYGDGLADIDINELLKFHRSSSSIATLSAVKNKSRFGELNINKNNIVESFKEKPKENNNWINAGFFVLNKEIFDYLEDDNIDEIQWEKGPLKKIAEDGKLASYKHDGFWKPMDAMRDKIELEKLWKSNPIWKKW